MSEVKEIQSHLDIQTLVIAPRQRREIAVGDIDSFRRIAKETTGIRAVLWNEASITLMTGDPSTTITFRPELVPETAMFFQRETKRDRDDIFGVGGGVRVWEGEYEPIKFSKSNLLKFLKAHAFKTSTDIIGKVKEMKINERHTTTETMINLENDDNSRTTEEKELSSNLPPKFSIEMPLVSTPDEIITVNLDFEASLFKVVDRDEYRTNLKTGTYIQLRCVNAREKMHELMLQYANQVPETIPKYYGRLAVAIAN